VRKLFGWIPRGAHLSAASFASRHRVNTWLLWLHLPMVVIVGLAEDRPAPTIALFLLPQLLFALLAWVARGRIAKATLTAVGLVVGTVVLFEISGGGIEALFQPFVVLVFVALYQQWHPIQLSEGLASVSGSVGTAVSVNGDQTADALMRAADAAMYGTKRDRKSIARR
jgi:methyl-accepting chemotaxis protein